MHSNINKITDLLGKLNFPNNYSKPSIEVFNAAHQQVIPTSIRINPLKPACSLDLSIDNSVPWESNAFYLKERPKFNYQPLFHSGAYYVQEASSMMTGYFLKKLYGDKLSNLTILDLCAAPGGKSTHIASMLDSSSLLISNEVIQARANVLTENISKWGQMNTWVTNQDPHKFKSLNAFFDAVIVDAPCTGSGLWRRDEKAMDEWSENNVKLCSERQKRILSDIQHTIIPEGYLIYSTCSYSKEENEDIVDWFCDEFGFETISMDIPMEWNVSTSETESKKISYRLAPWNLKGEGFFIAVFKKKSNIESTTQNVKPPFHKKTISPAETFQSLSEWFDIPIFPIEKNGEWYAIPLELKTKYNQLQLNGIKLKKTGTAIGSMIKQQLIPNHELALSVHLKSQYPIIHLNYEQSIQFLKKEHLTLENSYDGWHLVKYNDVALGWGKWMKNRMNNYYPKNWRIL